MIDLEYIVLHLSTKISIMSRDSLGYFRRGLRRDHHGAELYRLPWHRWCATFVVHIYVNLVPQIRDTVCLTKYFSDEIQNDWPEKGRSSHAVFDYCVQLLGYKWHQMWYISQILGVGFSQHRERREKGDDRSLKGWKEKKERTEQHRLETEIMCVLRRGSSEIGGGAKTKRIERKTKGKGL